MMISSTHFIFYEILFCWWSAASRITLSVFRDYPTMSISSMDTGIYGRVIGGSTMLYSRALADASHIPRDAARDFVRFFGIEDPPLARRRGFDCFKRSASMHQSYGQRLVLTKLLIISEMNWCMPCKFAGLLMAFTRSEIEKTSFSAKMTHVPRQSKLAPLPMDQ